MIVDMKSKKWMDKRATSDKYLQSICNLNNCPDSPCSITAKTSSMGETENQHCSQEQIIKTILFFLQVRLRFGTSSVGLNMSYRMRAWKILKTKQSQTWSSSPKSNMHQTQLQPSALYTLLRSIIVVSYQHKPEVKTKWMTSSTYHE